MANVFWETESQSLGGVTINIYYMYFDSLRLAGGGKFDNGGLAGGASFLHANQTRLRVEFISWRTAMAWYAAGQYHFVVTQVKAQEDGKIIAVPVSTGPGECANRSEYLINQLGYWVAVAEQPVASYTGYTSNNLVQREHKYNGKIRTSDEHHAQPLPVYNANHITIRTEWKNWTKGILNDLTGAATAPNHTTLGSHPGAAVLQTPLAFHYAVRVRALDVHFLGDPNQIRLQLNFTGLSASPFIQINPITGSYPSTTPGRTIHVANFVFNMGAIGEVKGNGFISIQAYKDGFTHSNGDQERTITFAIDPLGYVRPPPYTCPTIDNKILEGGYFPV